MLAAHHFGACGCHAFSAGGLIKAKILSRSGRSIIGTGRRTSRLAVEAQRYVGIKKSIAQHRRRGLLGGFDELTSR